MDSVMQGAAVVKVLGVLAAQILTVVGFVVLAIGLFWYAVWP